MQIVGVDFGTTNVRIATWDTDQPGLTPQPRLIGEGDVPTMPAVVAFQRQRGGAVSTIVGEDADILDDGPDTIVVRNIKRWALSNDPYIRWHLESSNVPRPTWWNPLTRSVEVWGQEFPVEEVVRRILAESFQRAGISGDFKWRAGCPVHAGFDYRSGLAQVLSEFGGDNRVDSVIEEPILFLGLAHRLESLQPGSYLVYDL
jgi:molecular chaperone DnaK (HSP70)